MKITGRTAATIAVSLEKNLYAGERGTGEPLPTVRALAATLRVSPATVAAAYKLLRDRGFVTGQGRRGTRVALPRPTLARAAPPMVPEGTVDLASGNPDPLLLPEIGGGLRAVGADTRLYGERDDLGGLVAFARGEFEADGIPTRSIAVMSGAMDAVERVLREHLRPGDRVGVEDPSFPGLIDLVAAYGYGAVPLDIDADGPRPDRLQAALRSGCRAVVMTPRAHNPTGAAVNAARAVDLKRVLRAFPDVLLIENDYAAPVSGAIYQGLRPDNLRHWVVVRSTAKFLGPDLRVALMAGDELTVNRVRARQALGARWVSHVLQQLTLALWSDPSRGRQLARAAELYAHRRLGALAALRERGIDAHASSGFNLWIPLRDEVNVVQELAHRGWAVAPGERFRIRSAPGIRVTISTLQPVEAARFAADLASALRPVRAASA
jgi:DNA-binding transcriptional MocR family regulator